MQRREALKHTVLFFGYAVSTAALTETFVACSREAKLDWKPEFLSANQANTVAEMAETILPKTKTPGAKELGVPQFVDKMVKDLLSKEEQEDFLAGLEKVDDTSKDVYGKTFTELTTQQREELLLKLDKEAAKLPPSVWGIRLAPPGPTAFFRRLKELTLLGYYTSQKVGKEILSFDPLPGGFTACMPLAEVGYAWNE